MDPNLLFQHGQRANSSLLNPPSLNEPSLTPICIFCDWNVVDPFSLSHLFFQWLYLSTLNNQVLKCEGNEVLESKCKNL